VIPKIMHQVWLGPKPLPTQYLEWSKKLRELHPDWEYYLWTDADIHDLKLTHLLPLCVSYSSKSNVIRMEVVNTYGGIYCDMDVEPLQSFDRLLSNEAFIGKESEKYVCNGFFGTTPNHPWLCRMIAELPQWVHKSPPWGPTLFSRELTTDVTVYPEEVFLHGGNHSQITESSLTIHHFHTSWGADQF
jgi:mannosyltransferase OCH1-like enzyme